MAKIIIGYLSIIERINALANKEKAYSDNNPKTFYAKSITITKERSQNKLSINKAKPLYSIYSKKSVILLT